MDWDKVGEALLTVMVVGFLLGLVILAVQVVAALL
jgi:hypothetical protein